MTGNDLPTVSADFIKSRIEGCPKLEHTFEVGGTTAFVLKGGGKITNRLIVFPQSCVVVGYEYAVAVALKCRFLPELMTWLEENRHWKDGAYFVPK